MAEFSREAEPGQMRLSFLSAQNFYGLDILPFAVEIAKVTMMIARKLAIDELHITEQPLPLDNLDQNFIACDALLTPDGLPASWPKADVIIASGGVSVGEADYVKETLDKMGKVEFWKVAMKPGRPLAFGRVDRAWFFGLPGNPVSVMVTFYQFVQPALRQLMGDRTAPIPGVRVRCASKLKKRPGRVEYQRGILERDETGELVVRKTGAQGSGILRSMSQANCFIVLPLENAGVEPGATVEVQPFFGLV